MHPQSSEGLSSKPIIVAVDGPAGSGKSSICSSVANQLGWTYVNTGILYRIVGFVVLEKQLNPDSQKDIIQAIDSILDEISWDYSERRVLLGTRDIGPLLSSVDVGNMASYLAKNSYVRDKLLPLQRQVGLFAPRGVILDGRDIGTVVFPDAALKIFLTASLESRAKRRYNQILKHGNIPKPIPSVEELMEDIKKRDIQDAQREAAPMVQARDAILLDTSHLSFEESVSSLLEHIKGINHS